MKDWKRLIQQSITTPEDLASVLDIDVEETRRVHAKYPLRVNPYYLSLIEEKGDPIWRQAIPDLRELTCSGFEDPLAEEEHSPAHNVTHRYPDRVLFYVSYACPVYCRFCTRKRKVGDATSVHGNGIELGLEYIRQHPEVRDVIVSGGDPLLLSDARLESILKNLRMIRHVEIIRIGTRVPVTLPQRVTPELCGLLREYHPLYVNTHFSHPREITPESKMACDMLADAGIPLGNQSVLLKGVNDKPGVMKELVQKLLAIRVRPYYIYQADLARGTEHFRTSVQTGLDIIKSLRGHTTGLAVPHYVIDAPGGGGKIAIAPNPVVSFDDETIVVRNYRGSLYTYPSMPCE